MFKCDVQKYIFSPNLFAKQMINDDENNLMSLFFIISCLMFFERMEFKVIVCFLKMF